MPVLRIVSFKEDVIAAVLQRIIEGSYLIFPSRASAAIAEQVAYQDWTLEDVSYFSMDDFKTLLTLSDMPVLQEDKRLICLYRAMTAEDREFYHIYRYGDLVGWGQEFFKFFDELADELVEPRRLIDFHLSGGYTLQHWQEVFIERICEIRERYGKLVSELGFTDRIFLDPASLHLTYRDKTFIFVNQNYYSALEKLIIERLEQNGNRVEIIFQGPAGAFDFDRMRAGNIALRELLESGEHRCEKIEIQTTENEDQMALDFLSYSIDKPGGTIVDAQYSSKAYGRLIDESLGKDTVTQSFVELFAYQFLARVKTDIDAMHRSFEGRYLPLQNLLDDLSLDAFFAPLGFTDQKTLRDDLMKLCREDYLYVDRDLQIFNGEDEYNSPALKAALEAYLKVLDSFAGVTGIKELIALIDSPKTLKLEALLREEQLRYSNAAEVFYERLANFRSLEDLGLINDWKEISGDTSVAAGILELFLESLKTAQIRWSMNIAKNSGYEITNLLDSRNLSFERLVFFHVNEGNIPSNPTSVWLLNETQRSKLGLKTYDEIRNWERYYFLRLLMVSQRVRIYCHANKEQDIEPSSFVSELLQISRDLGLQELVIELPRLAPRISDLYQNYKKLSTGVLSIDSTLKGLDDQKSFFNLPYTKDDLPVEIRLGFYSLNQLIRNQFIWYILNNRKLKEPVYQVDETLSRRFFGTLIHEYLAVLMSDLSGPHTSYRIIKERLADRDYLQSSLIRILENPVYRLKLPQNYNWDFLRDIISGCIVDTMYWFFDSWLQERVGKNGFTLLPESERAQELRYKPYLQHGDNSIMIKGIADLRLETPDKYHIIDFKTGNHDARQMVFYELYYYLLDEPLLADKMQSTICRILDRDAETIKTEDKMRQKLSQALVDTLDTIKLDGFGLPASTTDRLRHKQLSRADLYTMDRGAKNV